MRGIYLKEASGEIRSPVGEFQIGMKEPSRPVALP
jgi:hypothetical protein